MKSKKMKFQMCQETKNYNTYLKLMQMEEDIQG